MMNYCNIHVYITNTKYRHGQTKLKSERRAAMQRHIRRETSDERVHVGSSQYLIQRRFRRMHARLQRVKLYAVLM